MTTQTLSSEPLLRAALGEALRAFRVRARLTLRELSDLATVSPGYLSEIERGRKEVSSELLASVCQALEVSVAAVLLEAVAIMAIGSRPQLGAGSADVSRGGETSRTVDGTRPMPPSRSTHDARTLERENTLDGAYNSDGAPRVLLSRCSNASTSADSMDGILAALDDSPVEDALHIPDTVPEHLIQAYLGDLARRG